MERSISLGFCIVGLLFFLLAVAAFFGLMDTFTLSSKEMRDPVNPTLKNEEIRLPSFASGGSASGFAIASGLCFIAAALANRWELPFVLKLKEKASPEGEASQPTRVEAIQPDLNISQLPKFPK